MIPDFVQLGRCNIAEQVRLTSWETANVIIKFQVSVTLTEKQMSSNNQHEGTENHLVSPWVLYICWNHVACSYKTVQSLACLICHH